MDDNYYKESIRKKHLSASRDLVPHLDIIHFLPCWQESSYVSMIFIVLENVACGFLDVFVELMDFSSQKAMG